MCSECAFLATAETIGRSLVAEAVWHDGRCNWVGAATDQARPWYVEYRSLGPSLYGGTAGVGLVLARLATLTGDVSARRTAVGALRHAIARVSTAPPQRRDGFYGGAVGVAWALAQSAVVLGEEALDEGARAVLSTARPHASATRCPDVMEGAAGAILGLVALADMLDDPGLVEEAAAIGEALLAHATVRRLGWSWAIPGRQYPHHLCGLSHGAAGVGWALSELYAATGDERFRTGAMGAFAYERAWLDPGSGTWPDLRASGQRPGVPRTVTSPSVGTWCHGEAGIALTRLRAVALLGEAFRREADLALETTWRRLGDGLRRDVDDLSLCHGLAGAADALLCGAAALGGRWREPALLAAALGNTILDRRSDRDWPVGLPGGRTPGLFLGLSGIAWLLIRLHDGTIPSPLMVTPPLTPKRRQLRFCSIARDQEVWHSGPGSQPTLRANRPSTPRAQAQGL